MCAIVRRSIWAVALLVPLHGLPANTMADERPSDQQLQVALEQKLNRNLRATNAQLNEKAQLRVTAGVVTLSGELPSYSDRLVGINQRLRGQAARSMRASSIKASVTGSVA